MPRKSRYSYPIVRYFLITWLAIGPALVSPVSAATALPTKDYFCQEALIPVVRRYPSSIRFSRNLDQIHLEAAYFHGLNSSVVVGENPVLGNVVRIACLGDPFRDHSHHRFLRALTTFTEASFNAVIKNFETLFTAMAQEFASPGILYLLIDPTYMEMTGYAWVPVKGKDVWLRNRATLDTLAVFREDGIKGRGRHLFTALCRDLEKLRFRTVEWISDPEPLGFYMHVLMDFVEYRFHRGNFTAYLETLDKLPPQLKEAAYNSESSFSGIVNEIYQQLAGLPAGEYFIYQRAGRITKSHDGQWDLATAGLRLPDLVGLLAVNGNELITPNGTIVLASREFFRKRVSRPYLRDVFAARETTTSLSAIDAASAAEGIQSWTEEDMKNPGKVVELIDISERNEVSLVALAHRLFERMGCLVKPKFLEWYYCMLLAVTLLRRIGTRYQLMGGSDMSHIATKLKAALLGSQPLETHLSIKDLKRAETDLKDPESIPFQTFVQGITTTSGFLSDTSHRNRSVPQTYVMRMVVFPALIARKEAMGVNVVSLESLGSSWGIDLLELVESLERHLIEVGKDPSQWTALVSARDLSQKLLIACRDEVFGKARLRLKIDLRTPLTVLGIANHREAIAAGTPDVQLYRSVAEYLRPDVADSVRQSLNGLFLLTDEHVIPPSDRYQLLMHQVYQRREGGPERIQLSPEREAELLHGAKVATIVANLQGLEFAYSEAQLTAWVEEVILGPAAKSAHPYEVARDYVHLLTYLNQRFKAPLDTFPVSAFAALVGDYYARDPDIFLHSLFFEAVKQATRASDVIEQIRIGILARIQAHQEKYGWLSQRPASAA